jgi:hypothetical protein
MTFFDHDRFSLTDGLRSVAYGYCRCRLARLVMQA